MAGIGKGRKNQKVHEKLIVETENHRKKIGEAIKALRSQKRTNKVRTLSVWGENIAPLMLVDWGEKV